MTVKPTKPTVPAPPLRSNPSTFSSLMEASLLFWDTFATYMSNTNDYTEEQADAALAAALATNLPALTGQAGRIIRVNATEDGVVFVPELVTLSGASVEINPDNGLNHKWTLGATGTLTASFPANSNTIMVTVINPAGAYDITSLPTMTWVNNAGSPPTFLGASRIVFAMWSESSALFGALIGDGS